MKILRAFLALALLGLAAPAWAQLPCGPYPTTLTNGTIADANQVMDNFNLVRNCVNSLNPIGTPNTAAVTNLSATLSAPAASVTFTADQVQVSTLLNGATYRLSSYSQTLNTATTGAGGLDTGTLVGSSTYGIYAIYNPTSTAVSIIATLCGGCTTIYGGGSMPAGFTASALLALWNTNGTPLLIAGQIQPLRGYFYCAPQVTVLTSGSGNYGTPVCNGIFPTYLEIVMAGGGAGGVAAPPTNPPTAGGNTTFGALTANGGAISTNNISGGLGGTASGGDVNLVGGQGQGDSNGATLTLIAGGPGGCPVLFGGGQGTSQAGTTGGSASANSGCGGGGGGSDGTNIIGRPGGGGAGSLSKILPMPGATIAYSVGGGGNGGTSANQNGGAGGSGIIIITAKWY